MEPPFSQERGADPFLKPHEIVLARTVHAPHAVFTCRHCPVPHFHSFQTCCCCCRSSGVCRQLRLIRTMSRGAGFSGTQESAAVAGSGSVSDRAAEVAAGRS